MIRNILHIVLATLVLLSSSGLIINKHYCLDQLVSVALMADAEKCHIPTEDAPIKRESQLETLQQADCCKDTSSFHKVNQDQKAESVSVNLLELTDINWAMLPLVQLATFYAESSSFTFPRYKPPLLVWDLPVRLQTFLC